MADAQSTEAPADHVEVFVHALCDWVQTYRADHPALAEYDAVAGFSMAAGWWVALFHRHYFPQERHASLQKLQRLMALAMDDGWQRLQGVEAEE